MSNCLIRPVTPENLVQFDQALRTLSATLGDAHRADLEVLQQALFGLCPAAYGILAYNAETVIGAAMFSPLMSTNSGGVVLYVSDLWVAPQARSQQIGQQLLSHICKTGTARWQANTIFLSCYENNPRALAFYKRLGFTPSSGDVRLALRGDAFAALRDE